MKIRVDTFSISGIDKENEDVVFHKIIRDHCDLFVIADGMGALADGRVAAETAVRAVADCILREETGNSFSKDLFVTAIAQADKALYASSVQRKKKMGTAILVCVVENETAHITWLGNIRAYSLQNGKYRLLTQDHILSGTNGIYLTRCINGKGQRHEPPIIETKLRQSSRLLLCTDGYYRTFGEEPICAQRLQQKPDDDASWVEISFADE